MEKLHSTTCLNAYVTISLVIAQSPLTDKNNDGMCRARSTGMSRAPSAPVASARFAAGTTTGVVKYHRCAVLSGPPCRASVPTVARCSRPVTFRTMSSAAVPRPSKCYRSQRHPQTIILHCISWQPYSPVVAWPVGKRIPRKSSRALTPFLVSVPQNEG
jgi:hypothetical protein